MATRVTELIIKTSGGAETVLDLNKIGEAGDRAFRRVREGAASAPPHLRAVDAAMRDVRSGAERLAADLGPVGRGLSALGPGGLVAGAAVAGIGAIAAGFLFLTKRAIESGDAIADQAARTNIGVLKYQELSFAARQLGIDQGQLDSALQKFTKNVGEAHLGTGTLTKTLKLLDRGLLETIKGTTDSDKAIELILRKIASLPSAFDRASLAAAAFGKGAIGLAAVGKDIDQLTRRFHELGLGISAELIGNADRANDAIHALSDTFVANLNKSLLESAPLIEKVATRLADLIALVPTGLAQAGFLGLSPEVQRITDQLAALEERATTLSKEASGQGIQAFFNPQNIDLAKEALDQVLARIKELQAERDKVLAQEQAERDAIRQRKLDQEQANQAALKAIQDQAKASAEADAAEKQRASERKAVIKEEAELARDTARAGLEGVALLSVQRDQQLAHFQELLKQEAISQESFNKDALLIEQKFQAEKDSLELKEAEKQAEKIAKEQERAAKAAQKEFVKPFENALENIQRDFGQTFAQIIENGEASFKDLAGVGRRIFAQLAGEIASLLFNRAVTRPLLGQLAGLIGQVGVSAAAGTTGSGGGGLAGSLIATGSSVIVTGVGAAGVSGAGGAAGAGGSAAAGSGATAAAGGSAAAAGVAGGVVAAAVVAALASKGFLERSGTARGPSAFQTGFTPFIIQLPQHLREGNTKAAVIEGAAALLGPGEFILGLAQLLGGDFLGVKGGRKDFQREWGAGLVDFLRERHVPGAGRFPTLRGGLGAGRFGPGLSAGDVAFGATVAGFAPGAEPAFAAEIARGAKTSALDLEAAFKALGIGAVEATRRINQVFEAGKEQPKVYAKAVRGIIDVFTAFPDPVAIRLTNKVLEDGTASAREMRIVMRSLRDSVAAVGQAFRQSGGDVDTFLSTLAQVPGAIFAEEATKAVLGKGTPGGEALSEPIAAARLGFRHARRKKSPGGKEITPEEIEAIAASVTAGADDNAASLRALSPVLMALAESGKAVTKAYEDALGITEKNRVAFNEDVKLGILEITDPKAAILAALEREHQERRKAAEETGADLVEVDRLYGLKRKKIEEQIAQDALEVLRPIQDFWTEWTSGSSSPLDAKTRLENAQRAFDPLDPASVRNLDAAARDYYGSSPGYFATLRVAAASAREKGVHVPAFQHGGSFLVPGAGGIDSQLVAFRATPREMVTVSTPDQYGRMQSTFTNFGRELVRFHGTTAHLQRQMLEEQRALRAEFTAVRSRLDRLVARTG